MAYDQSAQSTQFSPRMTKDATLTYIKSYYRNPERYNDNQLNTLSKHAEFYQLPMRKVTEDESKFNIFRGLRQVGEGFLQGYTTIRVGEEPINPWERFARAAGQAAGFAGYIPSFGFAPLRAIGGVLRGKSLPILASRKVMNRLAPTVYTSVKATSEVGRIGALRSAAKFLMKPVALDVAKGAAEIGVAGAVSSWQDGITGMMHGFVGGGSMEIGDRLITNAFGLAMKGNPGAQAVARTIAGAMWNGLPSTMRGDSSPEQVYNYMIGGLFAANDKPVQERWAHEAVYDAMRTNKENLKDVEGFADLPKESKDLAHELFTNIKSTESVLNSATAQLLSSINPQIASPALADQLKLEAQVLTSKIRDAKRDINKIKGEMKLAKATPQELKVYEDTQIASEKSRIAAEISSALDKTTGTTGAADQETLNRVVSEVFDAIDRRRNMAGNYVLPYLANRSYDPGDLAKVALANSYVTVGDSEAITSIKNANDRAISESYPSIVNNDVYSDTDSVALFVGKDAIDSGDLTELKDKITKITNGNATIIAEEMPDNSDTPTRLFYETLDTELKDRGYVNNGGIYTPSYKENEGTSFALTKAILMSEQYRREIEERSPQPKDGISKILERYYIASGFEGDELNSAITRKTGELMNMLVKSPQYDSVETFLRTNKIELPERDKDELVRMQKYMQGVKAIPVIGVSGWGFKDFDNSTSYKFGAPKEYEPGSMNGRVVFVSKDPTPIHRVLKDVHGIESEVEPLIISDTLVQGGKTEAILPYDSEWRKSMVQQGVYKSLLKYAQDKQYTNKEGEVVPTKYYYFGGVSDKGRLNFAIEHPELKDWSFDAFITKMAEDVGVDKEYLSKEMDEAYDLFKKDMLGRVSEAEEVAARELFNNTTMNNYLYLKDINRQKDFKFIVSKGFIASAKEINKRAQILFNSGSGLDKSFTDILNRGDDYKLKYVIKEQNYVQEFDDGTPVDLDAHNWTANQDGSIYVLRDVLDAMNKSKGMPTEAGVSKSFIVDTDSELGALLGKYQMATAPKGMEEYMRENGLDMIMLTSTTKQRGLRSGIENYGDDLSGAIYELDPKNIKIVMSEITDKHHALSNQKLPKQVSTTFVANIIKHSPQEVSAFYRDLVSSGARGSEETNAEFEALVAKYDENNPSEYKKEMLSIINKLDELSLENIVKLFKMADTSTRARIMREITVKNNEDIEDDGEEGEARLEDESKLKSDNKGSQKILDLAGTGGMDFAVLDKFVSQYNEAKIKNYFVNRLVRPKIGNSAVAKIASYDEFTQSRYPQLKKDRSIFMLGGMYKELPISYSENGKTIKTTLGRLWDDSKKGGISDSANKALNAAIMRVPMDDASGLQVLKFGGFIDGQNTAQVYVHPFVKEMLGGADDDGDKAFMFFGGNSDDGLSGSGMKDSWLKMLKDNGDTRIFKNSSGTDVIINPKQNMLDEEYYEDTISGKEYKVSNYKIEVGAIERHENTAENIAEILAQTNYKDKSIKFNPDVLIKKFNNKAWTIPAKYSDGSSTTPLPEDSFKSPEELLAWVFAHEDGHFGFRREDYNEWAKENGETPTNGGYEDAINRIAFAHLPAFIKHVESSGLIDVVKKGQVKKQGIVASKAIAGDNTGKNISKRRLIGATPGALFKVSVDTKAGRDLLGVAVTRAAAFKNLYHDIDNAGGSIKVYNPYTEAYDEVSIVDNPKNISKTISAIINMSADPDVFERAPKPSDIISFMAERMFLVNGKKPSGKKDFGAINRASSSYSKLNSRLFGRNVEDGSRWTYDDIMDAVSEHKARMKTSDGGLYGTIADHMPSGWNFKMQDVFTRVPERGKVDIVSLYNEFNRELDGNTKFIDLIAEATGRNPKSLFATSTKKDSKNLFTNRGLLLYTANLGDTPSPDAIYRLIAKLKLTPRVETVTIEEKPVKRLFGAFSDLYRLSSDEKSVIRANKSDNYIVSKYEKVVADLVYNDIMDRVTLARLYEISNKYGASFTPKAIREQYIAANRFKTAATDIKDTEKWRSTAQIDHSVAQHKAKLNLMEKELFDTFMIGSYYMKEFQDGTTQNRSNYSALGVQFDAVSNSNIKKFFNVLDRIAKNVQKRNTPVIVEKPMSDMPQFAKAAEKPVAVARNFDEEIKKIEESVAQYKSRYEEIEPAITQLRIKDMQRPMTKSEEKQLVELKSSLSRIVETLKAKIGNLPNGVVPVEQIVRGMFNKTITEMKMDEWKVLDRFLADMSKPTFLQRLLGDKLTNNPTIQKIYYFMFPDSVGKLLEKGEMKLILDRYYAPYSIGGGRIKEGIALKPTNIISSIQNVINGVEDIRNTQSERFRAEFANAINPYIIHTPKDGMAIHELLVLNRHILNTEQRMSNKSLSDEDKNQLLSTKIDLEAKKKALLKDNKGILDNIYNVNTGTEMVKMSGLDILNRLDGIYTKYNEKFHSLLSGKEEAIKKYEIPLEKVFGENFRSVSQLSWAIDAIKDIKFYDHAKFVDDINNHILMNKPFPEEIGIDGLTKIENSFLLRENISRLFAKAITSGNLGVVKGEIITLLDHHKKVYEKAKTGRFSFDSYFPIRNIDTSKMREIAKTEIKKLRDQYDDIAAKLEKSKDETEKRVLTRQKNDVFFKLMKINAKVNGDMADGDFDVFSGDKLSESFSEFVDKAYDRKMSSQDKAIAWDVVEQQMRNQISREAGIVDHDMSPDTYIDYAVEAYTTFNRKISYAVVRSMLEKAKTKNMFGDNTDAWIKFIKIYVSDSLGKPTILTADMLNDPKMNLKGNPYTWFTDSKMRDTIYKIGKAIGVIKVDNRIPEEMQKPSYQSLIRFSQLEAQYEMAALLAHTKSLVANMFGGAQMTTIGVGFNSLKKANDIEYLQKNISPSFKTRHDANVWLTKIGIMEQFLNTDIKSYTREYGSAFASFYHDAIAMLRKDPNMSDSTLLGIAKKHRISDAMFDKAAWFMRVAERKLRSDAFLAHYIFYKERFNGALEEGYDKDGNFIGNPYLIKMAKDGIKATQFLYTAANRPAIARTAFGKILTRFQLWSYNSVKTRNSIYEQAKLYGFSQGTESYERFSRLMVMDTLSLALGQAFLFSLFDATLPAPLNWFVDLANWIFGDENERDKAFFGAYPYYVAPLQVVTPPMLRALPAIASGFAEGEWKRFTDYTIWTMFPFGRLARDIQKSYVNPKSFIDRMTGLPFQSLDKNQSEKDKAPVAYMAQ